MSYTEKYESKLLRGIEEPRPWDLIQEIGKVVHRSHRLLDIGCGTASKLINVTSRFPIHEVIGIEPNEMMHQKAKENVAFSHLNNICILEGRADQLPFEDEYFDIVTAMVAPHNTTEVYRVLKPGGYAIIEKIGDRDKWNLKEPFGKDEQGLRGQFCYYQEGEREKQFRDEFSQLFKEVSVRSGSWKTYYSVEELFVLLEQTPTIRNFNREKDGIVIEELAKIYMTEKGIETIQNRLLICARK
jgi:ubiquinone/menaquinone biosynthesis C-methylase UbiE